MSSKVNDSLTELLHTFNNKIFQLESKLESLQSHNDEPSINHMISSIESRLSSFDLEEPDYTEMELGRGLSLHDTKIHNEIRKIVNQRSKQELKDLPKDKTNKIEKLTITNMIMPVMLKHRKEKIDVNELVGFTRGVITRKLMTKKEKKTNNDDEDDAIVIPTTPFTQVPKTRKPPMAPKGPPAQHMTPKALPMTPKGTSEGTGAKKSRRRGKKN